MGKVVGEPYRGKPDVRFDEGAKGKEVMVRTEAPANGESRRKRLLPFT
jgi:predicted fused transcriptional regulator/phosphomethylpyrimidine kinase